MTDTPTADVAATVLQIKELVEAGSELVRMTINDDKAAEATPLIIQKLKEI
jgi:(E)-4-hydroxy-3-methylbut-2-enyl-diphosphate synthase